MSDAQSADTAIHLYGKIPREGRKIGHVTSIGDDRADVAPRARSIASKLRGDS
jgi:5-(carboxyamino)imidazole ribonucleotide synthase